MAIDVTTPDTPGWWLQRLAKKREAEAPELQALWDRYDGKAPLPKIAATMPEKAKGFFKKCRLNMAELVVGLKLERMKVRAIRTSDTQVRSDDEAMRMFTENDGLIFWEDALEKALVMGKAYLMVSVAEGAPRAEPITADDIIITAEDPRQTVTIQDPVRKSRVRAAAKFYHDQDFGVDHAYLFLQGRVYHATRKRRARGGMIRFGAASSWDWDETYGDVDGLELLPGWDGVPVRRMRNRSGVGEFERHTDPLDRIDHMILQRMVIATMQAFKQRAIKGDLPRTYPEDHPLAGKEIDYDAMFESDPGALWLLPATADVWESGQVDLSGILNAVKDDIRSLAALTRSSYPAMAPEGQNQSAEGASLAREGQTFATENRQDRFGIDLAWAIRTGFHLMGDERGTADVHVDWMPVDRYPITSQSQAAQAAKAAGMSKRFILEHIFQKSPDEVEREMTNTADDLLNAALAAAITPTPAPTPEPAPAPAEA